MAGSAKVTPIPNKNTTAITVGSVAFDGNEVPSDSPKGISPTFRPSIKIIRPTMTATSPKAIRVDQIDRKGSDRFKLLHKPNRDIRFKQAINTAYTE
jgi:hypothetical protein